MRKNSIAFLIIGAVLTCLLMVRARAIEIPLESLTPVRIGYVDLQHVFDVYPEKSFAEGDLLREIEKRRRELNRRQTEINLFRQQITADTAALNQAKAGQAVQMPVNSIPEPEVAAPAISTAAVVSSSAAAANIEPYPTEDPLAGLPGHSGFIPAKSSTASATLPGLQSAAARRSTWPLLDQMAATGATAVLGADALAQLQDRVSVNQRKLDRSIAEFRSFRTNAVGDMKQLQTEKTYGVMARIYATLQTLARDEGITVVLDKSYVLYGEDSVDLSDKLIQRLQSSEGS